MEVVDVEAVVDVVVELVVVGVVVDVVEVDVVDVELVELVELVEPPPVTVTVLNGAAGTGVVDVHGVRGAGPQPAGAGVPGWHAKVTAMMPPGPTSAVVELPPRLKATSPPVAVHVEVGRVADTASGVADSSPDVLAAGVGSLIVVTPTTETGASVWEPSAVLAPLRVTTTSAGMLLTPTVSRPRP